MDPATSTRAYDRLLLPVVKLKASTSSKQLEQRLNYLWGTAHALLATSPALAHSMAATILETARQHRTPLPPAVLDFLCQQCGALVVPSVSADVRVVAQRYDSPANRKLAKLQRQQHTRRERLQNMVHIKCNRCAFVTERHGASVVVKPKEKKLTTNKKRPLEATAAAAAPSSEPKRFKPSEKETGPEVGASEPQPQQQPQTGAPPLVGAVASAPPPVARSMFAKPASPPRRLLDAKKKKKKPSFATAAATAQVKSSLDSLLQTLKK